MGRTTDMDRLDGFELFDAGTANTCFLTVSAQNIALSSSAYKKLGKPSTLKLYFKEDTKQVAIAEGDEDDFNVESYRNQGVCIKIICKGYKDIVHELSGFKNGDSSFRVSGKYIKENNAFIFNLADRHPVSCVGRHKEV